MGIEDLTGNPGNVTGDSLEEKARKARRRREEEEHDYMPSSKYDGKEYPVDKIRSDYSNWKESENLTPPGMVVEEEYNPFINPEDEKEEIDHEEESDEEEEERRKRVLSKSPV